MNFANSTNYFSKVFEDRSSYKAVMEIIEKEAYMELRERKQ